MSRGIIGTELPGVLVSAENNFGVEMTGLERPVVVQSGGP